MVIYSFSNGQAAALTLALFHNNMNQPVRASHEWRPAHKQCQYSREGGGELLIGYLIF